MNSRHSYAVGRIEEGAHSSTVIAWTSTLNTCSWKTVSSTWRSSLTWFSNLALFCSHKMKYYVLFHELRLLCEGKKNVNIQIGELNNPRDKIMTIFRARLIKVKCTHSPSFFFSIHWIAMLSMQVRLTHNNINYFSFCMLTIIRILLIWFVDSRALFTGI